MNRFEQILQHPTLNRQRGLTLRPGSTAVAIGIVVLVAAAAAITFSVMSSSVDPRDAGASVDGDVTDGWYRAISAGLGETGSAAPRGNDVVDGWAAVLVPPRADVRDGWEAVLAQPGGDIRDGWDHRYFGDHE